MEDLSNRVFNGIFVICFSHRSRTSYYWSCECHCGKEFLASRGGLVSNITKSCGCLRYASLIGKCFGRLTVISLSSKTNAKHARFWNCICECGKAKVVSTTHLKNGDTKSCGCIEQPNIIGHNFGKLTVLNNKGQNKNGASLFECLCECGNKITVKRTSLQKGKTKSCGCSAKRTNSSNPHWLGCGMISGNMWSSIRYSARIRNIPLEITIDEAWETFQLQNGLCLLSGNKLTFAENTKDHTRGGTTASLDRIDSTKGYSKNNIQWIHKDINRMKMNLPFSEFLYWCSLVTYPDKSKYDLIIPSIKKHGHRKGCGLIMGGYWSKVILGAKYRNLCFDLTVEDSWKIFLAQNGRCSITNLPIFFNTKWNNQTTQTASFDRINSEKGYTIDNCQWTHKTVNLMKNNFLQSKFINYCKCISENYIKFTEEVDKFVNLLSDSVDKKLSK